MKRIIPILMAVFALTACEKEPDTDKLDNEYMVYTDYDTSFDFAAPQTYYVADSILYINSGEKKEFWKADAAEQVRSTFIDNMSLRFTRVYDIADADIGLQLSYVASTYTFAGYGNDPWWYNYPYYWSPGYWGGFWGGWYYPYPIVYSYSTGSIIGEIVNLNVPDEKKLPVVWNTYISGLLNSAGRLNMNKVEAGINQAFTQSPYLK